MQALGRRSDATGAEKALRELLSSKAEVEYGVTLISATKAEACVRRARGGLRRHECRTAERLTLAAAHQVRGGA